MIRRIAILIAIMMAMATASCAGLEARLESVKLPRGDLQRVRQAIFDGLAATPDVNQDGTVDGLEWLLLIQATVRAWGSEG